MIREDAELHRTGLAGRVCEEFGFFDARGRAQVGGCLAALRALERAGRPAAAGTHGGRELRAARASGGGCSAVGGPRRGGTGAGAVDRCGRGRGAARDLARPDGGRTSARRKAAGGLPAALSGRFGARLAGRGGGRGVGAAAGGARPLDRLGCGAAPGAPASGGGAVAVPDPPGGPVPQLGLACTGAGAAPPGGGLRGALRLRAVLGGDVCGRGAFRRQCAGGQLAAAGRDGGPCPRGPQQRGGARAQAGVCLRTGARVAATAGCRRRRGPGERPAGARGWSGDRRLGAERVRRGAAGRRPAQRPAGRDDRTDGRQPDGVAAGRGQGGPGEDQGLLPVRGPARRGGDDAAQHPAPAPRAHAAPDARGADGAVHPRRHGPELLDASGLRGSGRDRHQPDRRADLGPASAFDAGGDPERPAAGRAERPVRRAAAEGSGPQRWAQQGAGGAQERALDRGLPGLRSWPGSSGPAGWCA